jgi:hypothetical protein
MDLPDDVARSLLRRIEFLRLEQWQNMSHDPNVLYMTPFVGPHIVVMGRTPTSADINAMAPNTLVFVVSDDPSLPAWGMETTRAAQGVIDRILGAPS